MGFNSGFKGLNIKMLSKDAKQFKSTPRSYLIEHIFCSLDKLPINIIMFNGSFSIYN